MIVVADTSPLNYLLLIDEVDVLPEIFGRVLIPRTVFQELQHPKAAAKVRQWVTNVPAWLEVRPSGLLANPSLIGLDVGERDAIQMALDLGVKIVLIDEAQGRQEAEKLHLEVRGTLGILERGSRLGMVDLQQALTKLDQTNFRLSPAVRAALMKRNPLSTQE